MEAPASRDAIVTNCVPTQSIAAIKLRKSEFVGAALAVFYLDLASVTTQSRSYQADRQVANLMAVTQSMGMINAKPTRTTNIVLTEY